MFKELSEASCRHAMAIITSNPFAWNHMRAEDGTYISELLIPTSHLPETFQHLSDNFRSMELRPQILHVDWACSGTATIPYLMHDNQLDGHSTLNKVSLTCCRCSRRIRKPN